MTDSRMSSPGSDAAALAREFSARGVVIIPAFHSPEELAPVQAAIRRWADSPAALPQARPEDFALHQTQVIAWHPIADGAPEFLALRDHPRLTAVTAAALADGSVDDGTASGDGCMVMLSRRGHRQAWHQDTDSDEPQQYFINRLIYPFDVDPAAGALHCVPGSHRAGAIPPGDPHGPIPGEIRVAPSAGTLVLVHSRCFHRVGVNTTDAWRMSVNCRAYPPGARRELGRYGVYRTGTYDFTAERTTVRTPR